jgi:predicted phage-related endonuclease
MKTHNLTQGSPEWLAYRLDHDNASEAAAMLGLSRTTTRTELLHMKHTGLGKEFSDWVQRNVLDYGHEVEAKVRPLIEAMIGEDLYPVTCSDGRLSASLDGLTMSEDIAFECKQWSAEIAAQVAAGIMPEQHMPQCQQILMVTNAKKVIFAVGDGTTEKLLTLDVFPDPAWFERIRAGWVQFHEDMAVYVPAAVKVEAVGHTPETLPALRIEVTGMVTASNLADYKAHALAVFAGINRELKTDQQFADADKVVKWCGDVEARLAAAKQHALSQTESIDALFRTIDDIAAEARRVRLELDKLVKARKEAVRGEIVAGGIAALREHVTALNARLGKPYMPAVHADFAGAIKGKRTIDSLQDAVDTLLANTKIESSATADRIQTNLTTLREIGRGHAFLFADTPQIVLKANDDLTALVKSRIADHEKAEAARIEAETVRIRAEVEQQERAKAEQAARVQAEAAAKAKRESEAEAAELLAAYRPAPVTAQDIAECVVDAEVRRRVAAVKLAPIVAPVATKHTARQRLNAQLDELNETELLRVLSFVESHYPQQVAA